MPSLKLIRKRVSSVRNTQKITKAMKMVSAAKLRRATERAESSRPYESEISGIIMDILEQVEWSSPLTSQREPKKVLLIILGSDRGLCGSLNANLFKAIRQHLKQNTYQLVEAVACGKKARGFCRKEGIAIREEHIDLLKNGDFSFFKSLSQRLIGMFLKREFDRVLICYNQFRSALLQLPTLSVVFPFEMPEVGQRQSRQFIYEPEAKELLERLVPMLLDFRVYRAALESFASEHAARMTAMDSATNNCRDMIGRLTLEMNRARQAAITKELMEIIGGAEAISA